MNITFTLNQEKTDITCHPLTPLLEIIRGTHALKGTHTGCLTGECNSCLVLVNDTLLNACLFPAFRLKDARVVTIEGFVKTREYTDIEKAFLAKNIIQCGFCAPSLVLTAHAILTMKTTPLRGEIEEFLAGNLCLFSGWHQVVDAIMLAAQYRRNKREIKRR
ncbi:MAG: hypothetical protein JW904_06600 [Spirochaetales bacterium]|nr:hypothetical protein [Spirochaetales bacterium]